MAEELSLEGTSLAPTVLIDCRVSATMSERGMNTVHDMPHVRAAYG